MNTLQMIKCACVVLSCFTIAGVIQTLFYKHPISALFAIPLDGGRTWRGQPLFGENKTWKGIVVFVPSTTLCFLGAGVLARLWPTFGEGLWPLSLMGWGGLGLVASIAYVLGELPNSMMKRQLGIPPGGAAEGPVARKVFIVWDQLDSLLMGLLVVAFVIETDWVFHLTCVLIGATVHWLFNVLFYLIGLKKEAR